MPKPPPKNRSFRPTRPNDSRPGERTSGSGRSQAPSHGPASSGGRQDRNPPQARQDRSERPAGIDRSEKERPQRFARPSGKPERPAGIHPTPSVARSGLLYGVHPVSAAWLNPSRLCRHLYATESAIAEMAPILARAASEGLTRPTPIQLDREAVDRMLPFGAVHQGLALDAEPLPELNLEDVLISAGNEPACILVLDQVTDPHNVGAILRSAAAFGAKGVVVQRRHAPEITGVLAKAASGAVEIVPVLRETNLSRALAAARDAGFFVVGLDEAGETSIALATLPDHTVLVLGAEGAGIRRLIADGCDLLARLPTRPPIGSLNVSNAAAVALYEVARRHT